MNNTCLRDRQTETGRQTERQADRLTDRQTDRDTETETKVWLVLSSLVM